MQRPNGLKVVFTESDDWKYIIGALGDPEGFSYNWEYGNKDR